MYKSYDVANPMNPVVISNGGLGGQSPLFKSAVMQPSIYFALILFFKFNLTQLLENQID